MSQNRSSVNTTFLPPYSIFMENSSEYYILSAFLFLLGLPPNLYLISYLLREKRQWTPINGLILWGRIISSIGLFFIFFCLRNNDYLCLWTYLVFPGILLHEKMNFTSSALLRYAYIFKNTQFAQLPRFGHFVGFWLITVIMTCCPYWTFLFRVNFAVWDACRDGLRVDYEISQYFFLIIYYVLMVNSFSSVAIDGFCYFRICDFVRKNSLRIDVIMPRRDTIRQIRGCHNVITASSSMMLWLITSVSMIPPSILLLARTADTLDASIVITLLNYQIGTNVVLIIVTPYLIIGSSEDLKLHLLKLKRIYCCKWCLKEDPSSDMELTRRSNRYVY